MSTTSTAQRRDLVVQQIRLAFAEVSREGGVSLHEAQVIDDYGSAKEREAARRRDTEQRWEDVPEADLEHGDTVLCFLDPIGFRYYLPAYMVWTLNHYEHSDSLSVDSTIYALDFSWPFRGHKLERFSLLSREQAEAVCAFLRFLATESAGMADEGVASKALQRYWGQFC